MKKHLLFLSLIVAIVHPRTARAQADIHFSQFYETSVLRNPALTGVFAEDYKIGALYRNQWSSIANPFQTAMISAEARINVSSEVNDFVSFGLLAYYDKAGSIDRKILTVYPAVNYNKSLEDEHNSFLSVGFTAGYMQYSFDASKATFNNQYQNNVFNASNPTGEQLPNPHMAIWDMGAGINFNSSAGEYNNVTYILGVSGYHLSRPKDSYYGDPKIYMDMRWNVNAAVSGKINDEYTFELQGNYALQGTFNETIAGGIIAWNKQTNDTEPAFAISGGLFYRIGDAIIPAVNVKYNDLAIGISYDVNVSGLKAATNMRGGYELTVFKTGLFKDKNANKSKVLCPNFY